MLSRISWYQYVLGCGCVIFIYYAVIGWKFYRHELISALKKLPGTGIAPAASQPDLPGNPGEQQQLAENIQGNIHELLISLPRELKDKAGIIAFTKERIPHLHTLSDAGLRNALSNLLARQLSDKYGFELNEQDKDSLWN